MIFQFFVDFIKLLVLCEKADHVMLWGTQGSDHNVDNLLNSSKNTVFTAGSVKAEANGLVIFQFVFLLTNYLKGI